MSGGRAKASEGDVCTDLDPNSSQTWLLSIPGASTGQVVPVTDSICLKYIKKGLGRLIFSRF